MSYPAIATQGGASQRHFSPEDAATVTPVNPARWPALADIEADGYVTAHPPLATPPPVKNPEAYRGGDHARDFSHSAVMALIREVQAIEARGPHDPRDRLTPIWTSLRPHGEWWTITEGKNRTGIALYGITAMGEDERAAAINWLTAATIALLGVEVATKMATSPFIEASRC